MNSKNRVLWPIFGALLVIAYFSPIFLLDKTFGSDGQFAAYAQGFSLWAGDWAAGWPIIADVVSMPIYPIRLIMYSIGASFSVFVLSAYLIGYAGAYMFLLRRHESGVACFGALVFVLSGWMMTHLSHTSMIHSVVWLPWILCGFELSLSRTKSAVRVGLLVVALATAMAFLAGHLQVVLYSLILSVVYGLFIAVELKNLRGLVVALVALSCGVGMAFPMLLPMAELVSYTFRETMDAAKLFEYSYSVRELPGLFLPLVFGATPHGWFGQDYIKPAYGGETLLYIPTAVAILSLIAVFTRTKDSSHIKFWSLIVVVAICFSFGDAIPPFGWITQNTPLLNKFRAPSRHLLEASLGLSVLCAYGLQTVLSGNNATSIVKGIALFVLLTFISIGVVVFAPSVLVQREGLGLLHKPIFVAAMFSLLVVICTVVVTRVNLRDPVKLIIVLALLLPQSAFIGFQFPWFIYAPGAKDKLVEPEWVRDFNGQIGHNYRVLGMDGWQSHVFEPDQSRQFGLRALGWYGPLINRPMSELSGVTNGGWTRREPLKPSSRGFDILSVKYISVKSSEIESLDLDKSRWKFVKTYGTESVFENLFVLPRARVVCNLSFVKDENALLTAIHYRNASSVSLDESALLIGDSGGAALGDDKCKGVAVIESESSSSMKILTNSSTEAFLVVADTWYPGWRAQVNQQSVDVIRVNHATRAVPIGRGVNTVKMQYSPSSFLIGLWGAVGSLAILIALVCFFAGRRGASVGE